MKRTTSYLCAVAMAVSTMGFGAVGANAQPMPAPTQIQAPTAERNIINVRSHRDRRSERRADRRERRGFERRGDRAYFRGHRGQRHARPGWRQHQGWWFPPAAFVAGAIIGGALGQATQPQQAPRRGMSQAHVQWCYDRYRSYRSSDNTFQPYQGPRRSCNSPYG